MFYRYMKYGTPLNGRIVAKLLKGVASWCPLPDDLRSNLVFYASNMEHLGSEELETYLKLNRKLFRYVFEDIPTSFSWEPLSKLLEEVE